MLERFRQRYPLGSLSSELLTIDRGKYLVRTSIQVNGTLLGTGMGEGDTIEQAEDRARVRAIAVLALDNEVAAVEPPKPTVSELSATEPVNKEVSLEPAPAKIPPKPAPASKKRKELPIPAEIPLPIEEPLPLIPAKTETEPLLGEPSDLSEVIAKSEEELPTPAEIPLPVEAPLPLIPAKTETESLLSEPSDLSEVIAKSEEELPTPAEIPLPVEAPLPLIPAKTETEPLLGEPIDFSEVIAKSDMELKRLGWTNEQGRNYLLATYGKRSRQLLSDEELIEFMQYLQSLPNP